MKYLRFQSVIRAPRVGAGLRAQREHFLGFDTDGPEARPGHSFNRRSNERRRILSLLLFGALTAAILSAAARAEVETGRTLEPVEIVIRSKGEVRGKAMLPKGAPVRILERKEGQVYLESRIGTEWVPASAVRVTMEPVHFEEAPSQIAPKPRMRGCRPCPPPAHTFSRTMGPSTTRQTTALASASGVRTSFERAVLDLTNQERKARGLPALQWSDSLAKAASYHAAHMASYRYLDHDTRLPGGKRIPPKERISRFDANWCGENIARGQRSPQQVVSNWMSSPGHRRNMLQPEAKRLGVGHISGYWVQVFGREEKTNP